MAFDSFKGTARAVELVEAARRVLVAPLAERGLVVDACPLADGGEGFLEVLAALAPEWHWETVQGPLQATVQAPWATGPRGLALVESARAAGLPLAGGAAGNDPLAASSRGVGELLAAALGSGARRVLVGVGGTACTDGGLGAVQALEEAGMASWVAGRVQVACDVRIRFVDAARQFGPQKGAGPREVAILERRLADLAGRWAVRAGRPVAELPGSGAGGGLAGGLAALGARLVPGARLVGRLLGLPERLARARVAVTGEGRLDRTSWWGKVVGEVTRAARRRGTPVAILAGSLAAPAPEPVPPELRAQVLACWALTDLAGADQAWKDPARALAEVLPGCLLGLLDSR